MAPSQQRAVDIAAMSDAQLFRFLQHVRTSQSSFNTDLSPHITDFWDLFRVLKIEEHLRWQKHGNIHQRIFQLNETEWKFKIDRLVFLLQDGMEGIDKSLMAHMPGSKLPLPEKMVKTIPQDIMRLYQTAWRILGLAEMAQMGKPRYLPPYCSLAHFETFADRFAAIEQALSHNKVLARYVFENLEWMCRVAAHPMPEEQETEEETDKSEKCEATTEDALKEKECSSTIRAD